VAFALVTSVTRMTTSRGDVFIVRYEEEPTTAYHDNGYYSPPRLDPYRFVAQENRKQRQGFPRGGKYTAPLPLALIPRQPPRQGPRRLQRPGRESCRPKYPRSSE
jgi:hypothetical protein